MGIDQLGGVWRIHVSARHGAVGVGVFRWFCVPSGRGRNPFKAIAFPFLGCLTALSTSVFNSSLGPGLENLFVGLGPSGAWLAPCAQIVVFWAAGWFQGGVARTGAPRSEVRAPSRGEDFRRLAPFAISTAVWRNSNFASNGFRAHLGGDE